MLTSLHASTSGYATMSKIESFLRVKEDKRRELLKSWGLSGRQTVAWSEVWSAIGLDPHQDESLWEALKAPLLLPSDAAAMVGISVETLNGWCRTDTLPGGFPPPICVGPRKKLWINLDILARRQPEIYADAAGKIRRSRPKWQLSERPSVTLDPDLSIATLRRNSSAQTNLANLQGIETGTDGFMLAEIDELIADINADNSSVAESPMMDRVLSMLDHEIEAGAASSPRVLTKTALRSLLRTKGKRPENTGLSLDIFDTWFPLNGWNRVTMSRISREVYLSYRKRARAAIARALGVTEENEGLRRKEDRWTELAEWLSGLPKFAHSPASLAAVSSTLTLLCRKEQLSTEFLDQTVILRLYQKATPKQKRSLRNASRTIYVLQNDPEFSRRIREFFPKSIEPIRTGPSKKYNIPKPIQDEIDDLTWVSYRKGYIEIAQSSNTLADTTRDQHKYALQIVVDALLATGHLRADDETAIFALSNRNAMIAACRHIYARVKQGELAASTATTRMSYLPAILERNGIEISDLRKNISAVPEFRLEINKSEMPEDTQRLCRPLIDDLSFRADFLLSHAAPKAEADRIIDAARSDGRDLTYKERTLVRQLGTVALFCAIECGCAPIRVENFLEIPIGGSAPWLVETKAGEYQLSIPGTHTKNGMPIKAPLAATDEMYLDTVEWFLSEVRWLFFWDQAEEKKPKSVACLAKGFSEDSDWLIPGVKNQFKSLSDKTFRSWFEKIMPNVVGINVDPHNFRHGQASLLYYFFPDRIEMIALRLGDTVDTVLRYYACIHKEKIMREGQSMLVSLIDDRKDDNRSRRKTTRDRKL